MEMPSDWNNAEGWEAYYASLYPHGNYKKRRDIGSIPERDLPDFVGGLLSQGWKTAWIPGCGLSALPKLLAQLGMEVHATDISPTAIAFQQSAANVVASLPQETAPASAGTLTCAIHDFREPYLDAHIDLLINVKAIQAFPADTMKRVADVHFRALKPGRHAYFDTLNVQGAARETLEATLVDAGFFLPFYQLNLWYRQRLSETKIPYLFILGSPTVPWRAIYDTDKAKWEADRATLWAIADEYKIKAEQEQATEQARLTGDDKIATVIYSTG